ncbi:MAG: prepilin-type N-terminal cleavage/methylation domain-containing protein [Verrucomicrobiae bacterium]|nr:prepilin-type N-terminal cleavage/methylation domain-containing protein [Verrucomicrobiae bacterium]
MRRKTPARSGFTLVEIMIVVAIIGLLLAIAVPNFLKSRQLAQSRACINNLRQIQASKQVWGVEKSKAPTDVPTDDDLIGPTLYLKVKPACPAGGVYTYNALGQPVTCSVEGHTLEW